MANNDSLTSYGPNFQIKIISFLLSDNCFSKIVLFVVRIEAKPLPKTPFVLFII